MGRPRRRRFAHRPPPRPREPPPLPARVSEHERRHPGSEARRQEARDRASHPLPSTEVPHHLLAPHRPYQDTPSTYRMSSSAIQAPRTANTPHSVLPLANRASTTQASTIANPTAIAIAPPPFTTTPLGVSAATPLAGSTGSTNTRSQRDCPHAPRYSNTSAGHSPRRPGNLGADHPGNGAP